MLDFEEELKKLKSIMEEESDKPQNNIFLISLVVIFFISIILGIIIDNSNFKVLLYTISLGILIFIGFNFYINKKGSENYAYLNYLYMNLITFERYKNHLIEIHPFLLNVL